MQNFKKTMFSMIRRMKRVTKEPSVVHRKIAHMFEMRCYDKHLVQYFLESDDKSNAVILASFPKSGNTYLRFIFANIIALCELDGKTIDYHQLDNMLPTDLFEKDLVKPWPYRTLPCVLKTHNS